RGQVSDATSQPSVVWTGQELHGISRSKETSRVYHPAFAAPDRHARSEYAGSEERAFIRPGLRAVEHRPGRCRALSRHGKGSRGNTDAGAVFSRRASERNTDLGYRRYSRRGCRESGAEAGVIRRQSGFARGCFAHTRKPAEGDRPFAG